MTPTRLGAVLIAAAVIGAACGGGDDADTTTTAATTTTTEPPETTTTTTEPPETTTTAAAAEDDPLRQPLTGEIVEEADLETRPALAVKIDNHPLSRENHSGLAVADIVFEEIVEAELTRFAAVFHTNDSEVVGPVRSGRSQDVDILSSFNEPLFAWSGGNPGVTRLIAESMLTDLNWQLFPGSYERGPGPSPHDLYSTTDELYSLTPEDHPGAPGQQYQYLAANAAFDGQDVDGLDLTMRDVDVNWDWDEDREVFRRSQEGELHVDSLHGQINATNVIVMAVEYEPSSIDRNSPEAQTIGEGLAWIFSNGHVVEAKWQREVYFFALEFVDLDGNPIALTPGNTWVELAEVDTDAGPGEPPVELVIRYAT